MPKLKSVSLTGGGIVLFVIAVICINIIGSRFYSRLDVTAEKVFSLSEGTRRILDKLDDEVVAKLYFSRSQKDLPVIIKTYATRVEEVLAEYAAASKGKLRVEVIDPKPDSDEEEWALKYGIGGARLPKGEQLFFGVVFVAGSQEITIPYLDPRREENLEYDLSESLVRAFRKDRAKIGIMSSLPIMASAGGGNPFAAGRSGEGWIFPEELKKNFNVVEVPTTVRKIDDDIKLLVVVHPKNLDEAALYAVDQFVVRGGRLIVAVDPMARAEMATSSPEMMGGMPDFSSSLDQLFAAWGVEFDKARLVGDPALATQINAGGTVLAYPYFLSLGEGSIPKTTVITSSLGQMMLGEAGSISLKAESSLKLEPLLTTTAESGSASAQMAAFMSPLDMAKELKIDGQQRTVAGLITGRFKSAFKAAPASAPSDGKDPLEALSYKAEADSEGAIVVVADVDFLHDANSADKFHFGGQTMVRMRNDNLNFIFNAADFLGGSEDLIAIRSRGRIARPFTRVAAIQKKAQLDWQAEEEKLTGELTELQKKLNALQQQRTDGNRMVLSSQQQDEIRRFREQERDVRRRRREVRKHLREDIESLGHSLVAWNLLGVPLACSAFGVFVFMSRSRRTQKGKNRAS